MQTTGAPAATGTELGSGDDGASAPPGRRSVRRALAPPDVLLVEDDPLFAEFVIELLRDVAGSITTASTLELAQARLADTPIDCILLDLGLPDADGLDALDALLALDTTPPIVVLTGDDDPEQAVEAVARGAQDYVFKREAERTSLSRSMRHALERRRLDIELILVQRLEWLADLAGKVAHDYNNLLTVLFGHLELARLEIEGLPTDAGRHLVGHLDEIDGAAHRAAALTDELLAYSRAAQVEHRTLSVTAEIETLLPRLRSILEERTVELVSGDGPDLVVLDRDRFQDVMMSVAYNARDATSPGGRVVIRVETSQRGDRDDRPFVRIVVTDDGTGIDPSIEARMFEPFVSTRFTGAGLGLATTRNTIEAVGGTVSAASPDSGGAVVTITLPLAAPPAGGTDAAGGHRTARALGDRRRPVAAVRATDPVVPPAVEPATPLGRCSRHRCPHARHPGLLCR